MDELVDIILDYVRRDYTDYAIMINGEWGSGKTYFWDNKVRNKIESMELNGKKYKTIYMSLYGISNLEEISKKLFMETTQMMNKSLRKYLEANPGTTIPEYAKTGLDMANLFGVSQLNEKIDYTNLFNIEDKVLCFDDLERANVDVIDVLGYINNFVEHDHIKTIIICNEKELANKLKNSNVEMKTFIGTYILDKEGKFGPDAILEKPMVDLIQEKVEYIFDKANDYERIKEKLIGETFEYIPEFSYIINGLLMRYENNKELMRFLRENTAIIVATFNKTGTRNLRILKHALNDFEKIYENVKRVNENIGNDILQSLLIFTIAISFEIKAGKVTKNKFVDINSNEEYKIILTASDKTKDNTEFYLKEFDNNYYFNTKYVYRFFKFVEIYVRTRIFDMRVFAREMADIDKTTQKSGSLGYERILSEEYWRIPDEEFDKVIYNTLELVRSGKLELINYVKLFIYFNHFHTKGLLREDIGSIKNQFMAGMNLASVNAEYYPDANIYWSDFTGVETYADVDEVIAYFTIINAQLKEKTYKEDSERLMALINTKTRAFLDLLVEEYSNEPIIAYCDPNMLFEKILKIPNPDIVSFTQIVKDRVANKELYKVEHKHYCQLKAQIDNYVKGKVKNVKLVLLEELSSVIKCDDHIEGLKIYEEAIASLNQFNFEPVQDIATKKRGRRGK